MAISDVLSLLAPFINTPISSATSLSKNGAVNLQQIQQIAQTIFSQGTSASGQGGIFASADFFKQGQDISSLTKNSMNILEILNGALGGSNQATKTAVFNKDPIKQPVKTDTFEKLDKDDKTNPPYYFPKKQDAGTPTGGGTSTA